MTTESSVGTIDKSKSIDTKDSKRVDIVDPISNSLEATTDLKTVNEERKEANTQNVTLDSEPSQVLSNSQD